MAAKAFVLVETAVGRTREVASTLEQLEGVKDAPRSRYFPNCRLRGLDLPP